MHLGGLLRVIVYPLPSGHAWQYSWWTTSSLVLKDCFGCSGCRSDLRFCSTSLHCRIESAVKLPWRQEVRSPGRHFGKDFRSAPCVQNCCASVVYLSFFSLNNAKKQYFSGWSVLMCMHIEISIPTVAILSFAILSIHIRHQWYGMTWFWSYFDSI